jgi:cobalt-zinc-cadmium efflux system membrane fusion protein
MPRTTSGHRPGLVVSGRAPFAGTVIEKSAVLGRTGAAGQSLFTVADLSSLWIEANLFEKDLNRVRPGARATVTVSAYPDEPSKDDLHQQHGTETRAVPARIEVPNPDRRLKPRCSPRRHCHRGDDFGPDLAADSGAAGQWPAHCLCPEGKASNPGPLSWGTRWAVASSSRGIKPGEPVVVAPMR